MRDTRAILHSDLNCFYASVEMMLNPALRDKAVAVCGSTEDRHGIVLAKSEKAKKAGVKTGMVNWEARQCCPELIIVPPQYDQYLKYSALTRNIYNRYTDLIEPFGMDECWCDVTGNTKTGVEIAEEIRRSVREELGMTVSIGVSWNKVFAKLGSDYKKPDAVTVISRDTFRDMVWPLPAQELLYVGRSTSARLSGIGVSTIGAIARADPELLRRKLGKAGDVLHAFANGNDCSPVRRRSAMPEIKSIGNGTTTPRDMATDMDIWVTLMALCESVGMRLREKGMMGSVIEIGLRNTNLEWISHQIKLRQPTDITKEILDTAFMLFKEAGSPLPLRSISIRCTQLVYSDLPEQMDLFCDHVERDRLRRLDAAMDNIRRKYGYASLKRGTLEADIDLGSLNAKEEHTVHPMGFFNGYGMADAIGKEPEERN